MMNKLMIKNACGYLLIFFFIQWNRHLCSRHTLYMHKSIFTITHKPYFSYNNIIMYTFMFISAYEPIDHYWLIYVLPTDTCACTALCWHLYYHKWASSTHKICMFIVAFEFIDRYIKYLKHQLLVMKGSHVNMVHFLWPQLQEFGFSLASHAPNFLDCPSICRFTGTPTNSPPQSTIDREGMIQLHSTTMEGVNIHRKQLHSYSQHIQCPRSK